LSESRGCGGRKNEGKAAADDHDDTRKEEPGASLSNDNGQGYRYPVCSLTKGLCEGMTPLPRAAEKGAGDGVAIRSQLRAALGGWPKRRLNAVAKFAGCA
jgi:hypothetical protein